MNMAQQEPAVKMVAVPPAPKRPTKKGPSARQLWLEANKRALEAAPNNLVYEKTFLGTVSDDAAKTMTAEEVADLKDKKARTSARNAAYQINLGERQEWPGGPQGTYYGAFQKTPEDEGGEGWQLVIGLRSHLPEEWAEFVNRAGARRAKASGGDVEMKQETATDDDPFGEDEDE